MIIGQSGRSKWPLSIAFILISILPLCIVQSADSVGDKSMLGGNVYFVQFSQPPLVARFGRGAISLLALSTWNAEKQYVDELMTSHDQVLSHVFGHQRVRKVYSFTNVVNGIAVVIKNPQELLRMKTAPGVVRIQKDVRMSKQTTYSYQFIQLPTGLWSNAGGQNKSGEGLIIGLIDTGVDPTHPSFSDNVSPAYSAIPSAWKGSCVVKSTFPAGSCNNKLIGAQYFADGAVSAGIFNASYDFDSPLDGDGHGCHTLSIAGGNSNVLVQLNSTTPKVNYTKYAGYASGAAPRARLAVYKSLFRDGGTLLDTVAAIDKAVLDGVHVISISLCPDAPPSGITYLSLLDVALLMAVKAGVVVVQAAGNNGPSPGTVASFSPWIISPGATTMDRTYPVSVALGNNNTVSGAGITGITSGLLPMIYAADAVVDLNAVAATECQDPTVFNASMVAGRILICEYSVDFDFGSATVLSVATTARTLNASGFLLLTLEQDLSPVFFNPIPFPSVPGAFLTTYNPSTLVMQYYNNVTTYNAAGSFVSTTATASIGYPSGNPAQFGAQAPIVTSYSARGPSLGQSDLGLASDVLKPDIVAPGDQIWGAWTGIGIDDPGYTAQRFAMQSGTSMATPHVAGIAALLKQLHPSWSPAAIQSALVTTASTLDNRKAPITVQNPSSNPSAASGIATPFDFGGGQVNATAANDPGLIFNATFQNYINFLCSLPWATPSQVLNTTGGTCNITAGAKPSDLNSPSITISNLTSSRNVTRTATSVGTKQETYTAKVTNPNGVSVNLTPSSFTVQPNQSFSFLATIRVTKATRKFGFGSIKWTGNAGHTVQLPLSVLPWSL